MHGSDGHCWLKSAGENSAITRDVALSLFRECLSCDTLQDFVSRADGRRTADHIIGRTLACMLDELHTYDLQLQRTSSSLRKRVAELTVLNQISDALARTSELAQTVQLFLIGVTAGGAGSLNRALLFLAEEDELVGHTGLGHISREEGQKTWIRMAESGSELQQLIESVLKGTFSMDADLNATVRSVHIPRASGSPLAVSLRERVARFHGPEAGSPGHPSLDALYRDTPFVVVPLYIENHDVGIVVADNFLTGFPLSEENVSMVQTLAHQAAAEIMNYRLHDDLQRQLQETEHLYELLRENQNYLLQHERLVDMGKLATTVAHEIKTPLVAIGGFARRAERKLAAGEQPAQRDMEMIINEVSRLERITSEILDYSKGVKLNLEKVDLRQTLEESLDIVESRLESAAIQVEKRYPDQACTVKADARRLKQVMLNLLENAIDALSGSPTQESSGGHITVELSPGPEAVVLEMTDTGPGIPEDLFDRVFTPFFTTKPTGSGLGLAVTRRIITDHGGRISLSRTQEEHTKFRIEFPSWREPAQEEVLHVTNTGS